MSEQIKPLPANLYDYLTPQERVITTGSTESKHPGPDFYRPLTVIKGRVSPTEAEEIRQKHGCCLVSNMMTTGVFPEMRGNLVITLSQLVISRDGITYEDPKILGLFDPTAQRILEVRGRDLTLEFYDRLSSSGINLYLRTTE